MGTVSKSPSFQTTPFFISSQNGRLSSWEGQVSEMREPMWRHLYPPSGSFGYSTMDRERAGCSTVDRECAVFPRLASDWQSSWLRLQVCSAMSWPAQCHPFMAHNAGSHCKSSQTELYHADWHVCLDSCIQTLKEKSACNNAEARTENLMEAKANINP